MSDTKHSNPRVGIAAFVYKDGKFLMGQRFGSHGAGTWSVPGGHLEFGESWAECAAREVLEETGVQIKNIKFFAITNEVLPDDNKHYVSIWMTSDWDSGEPTITEPDKMMRLAWRDFKSLPNPLFEPFWTNLKLAKPELFS